MNPDRRAVSLSLLSLLAACGSGGLNEPDSTADASVADIESDNKALVAPSSVGGSRLARATDLVEFMTGSFETATLRRHGVYSPARSEVRVSDGRSMREISRRFRPDLQAEGSRLALVPWCEVFVDKLNRVKSFSLEFSVLQVFAKAQSSEEWRKISYGRPLGMAIDPLGLPLESLEQEFLGDASSGSTIINFNEGSAGARLLVPQVFAPIKPDDTAGVCGVIQCRVSSNDAAMVSLYWQSGVDLYWVSAENSTPFQAYKITKNSVVKSNLIKLNADGSWHEVGFVTVNIKSLQGKGAMSESPNIESNAIPVDSFLRSPPSISLKV